MHSKEMASFYSIKRVMNAVFFAAAAPLQPDRITAKAEKRL